MAESCNVSLEARSPQSTFSTFASKTQSRNYKKIFIKAFNEEDNVQEEPKSPPDRNHEPVITKPLPPLEPLFEESVPHAFVPVHPKKRLKREQDDPMLADAAASPGSCTGAEIRAQFESGHMLSNPNSPFPSLPSPLDTPGLSDSAYFSGLSPFSAFSSPGSVTQASSPVEILPPNASFPVNKPPQGPSCDKVKQETSCHKLKQETVCQKPCAKPLDLTSVPKQQRIIPRFAPYPAHLSQQHLVAAPINPSIQLLLAGGQQIPDLRKVLPNSCLSPAGVIAHTTHPQVSQPCYDRSPGIISQAAQPKLLYSQANPQLQVSFNGGIHVPQDGGGVIKPKPTHPCKRPFTGPYSMQSLNHRRKPPPLHFLPESQRSRMPSEMISQGFPRDMPNLAHQPPTASSKKVSWLHDDEESLGPHPANSSRSGEDDLGYKGKLIKDWTAADVIFYMFDAGNDCGLNGTYLNFYELDKITGQDLCQKTVEDFKKYVPRGGELMYQHFRTKVLEEKRHMADAAAAAQATSSHQDINKNRIMPDPRPHFEFINQPTNYLSSASHSLPHPVQHQQPPLIFRDAAPQGCDASAPYEIRYETVDARAIGLSDPGRAIGLNRADDDFVYRNLPSASTKRFDPLHAPSPAVHHFDLDDNVSDPDQSSNEEEVVAPEPPKKRGPGRPRKPENELKKKRKKTGRLWEFIRNLLLNPETCPSLVRWDDPEKGIFRFVQADKVAQRWGQRKQNNDMNYEKLSRAMRYYYKGEVFEPVLGRRLVYKFGKKATGWRPPNPNFTNQGPFPSHSSSH